MSTISVFLNMYDSSNCNVYICSSTYWKLTNCLRIYWGNVLWSFKKCVLTFLKFYPSKSPDISGPAETYIYCGKRGLQMQKVHGDRAWGSPSGWLWPWDKVFIIFVILARVWIIVHIVYCSLACVGLQMCASCHLKIQQ